MSSVDDAIKLYWPSHLCSPKTQQGFLLGWVNKANSICIASVVSGIQLDELQELLCQFCDSSGHSEFIHINKVCTVPPQIIGVLVKQDELSAFSNQDDDQHDWLKVTLNEAYIPVLSSLTLNSTHIQFNTFEVIFYEQPNPKRLQFLALEPLELDISSKDIPPKVDIDRKYTESIKHYKGIIEFGHKLHGETEPVSDELGSILIQINSSYYLEHGIHSLALKYKNKHLSRYPSIDYIVRLIHALYQSLVRIVITSPKGFIGYHIKKWIIIIFTSFLFLILALAEITLRLLSLRLPKFILNGVGLKDLFAAGQQIDLRLQQLFFWPRQYIMLRKHNWANTAKARAYYISFYNSMWLVANDIIIGLAIGSFLKTNNIVMANELHKILHKYTVESLQSMMLWFLESPAGLKLNHELASFLSELFLWLIRLWTLCTQTVEPFTPLIIYIIGLSGVFGVTMIISLSSDFLAFMTLHIYCFYTVAARIFNWQLVILSSLFNLFRGKKRNILRNRIDSCDYDLDQLLLGTSLFTLLTFLFPTVLIYYLNFALGRVGVIFLQAIMETILAFFNHFPLFAIMLRIKDPHRLPGGLRFEIFKYDDFLLEHHGIFHKIKQLWIRVKKQKKRRTLRMSKKLTKKRTVTFSIPNGNNSSIENKPIHLPAKANSAKGSYLWMRNMPIQIGAIFFQYMLLWKRLSAHYFSAYVFKCLLYGESIKPIPKLQYPMLPDKRPNLSTLWKTFKQNLLETRAKSEKD